MNILKIMMKLGTVKLVFRKFYHSAISQNIINLGNAGIDPNLKNLLRQLNNLSEKENIDNENLPNCKYRDLSYFSNLEVELKSKFLAFLHLNIKSLSRMKI